MRTAALRGAPIPPPLVAAVLLFAGPLAHASAGSAGLETGPFAALAAQASRGPVWTLEPGSFEAGGAEVAVDHGSLRVPADRSDPDGDSITIRFVRFATTATDPAPPLVFLAGGPGDSGTRAFRGIPSELLDRLRATGDVIALDQRGTGTSEPRGTRCPPVSLTPAASPGRAVNPDARAALEECVATAAERGIALSGLTTAESADDLEDLRRAAAAPSLRLLAGSYGTHLALSFARRHPESVAAMVLIGVEGPDDTFKLPARVDRVLERVAAAKRPSLVADLRTLRRRLAAAPAEFTLPGGGVLRLTEWDLQRWIAESLATVSDIDAMVAAVPRLLDDEHLPLARWVARQRTPRPVDLMNLAMDCASGASSERLERIAEQSRVSVVGDAPNYPKSALCDISGLPRLPDTFRTPVSSEAPALIVAGGLDGRTPVENAQEVAATLPNAELLIVDNVAHDLFGRPTVMRRAVQFLAGAGRAGSSPPPRTRRTHPGPPTTRPSAAPVVAGRSSSLHPTRRPPSTPSRHPGRDTTSPPRAHPATFRSSGTDPGWISCPLSVASVDDAARPAAGLSGSASRGPAPRPSPPGCAGVPQRRGAWSWRRSWSSTPRGPERDEGPA